MSKTWMGVEYANDDEIAMAQWCEEAKEKGLLLAWDYQCTTWELSPKIRRPRLIKGKPKAVLLLRECTYTADFMLYFWDQKIATLCGFTHPGFDLYIDIKPAFERQEARQAKFAVVQKWMYAKHGIYVYPVVPIELLKRTFLPRAQMISPTGKVRKVKAHVGMRTIEEFMTQLHKDNQ